MKPVYANALLLILALNVLWFVVHSAGLGARGLGTDLSGESRLWHADAPFATAALFLHMVLGAVLTVGAPLQAMPWVRRRAGLHRRAGYMLVALSVATGLGGLVYIAAKGTIGGPWMSAGFALYGALLVVAAVNTAYHALAKDTRRHFRWAARLVVLAVGSWIYRTLYGLWYLATDGAGSTETFTGPFDAVMVVAFYLPFLLALEAAFALADRRRAGARTLADRPRGA